MSNIKNIVIAVIIATGLSGCAARFEAQPGDCIKRKTLLASQVFKVIGYNGGEYLVKYQGPNGDVVKSSVRRYYFSAENTTLISDSICQELINE